MLTSEQLAQFQEQGFLVIPNYFSVEKVKELRDEAAKLLGGIRDNLANHPRTKFTSGDQNHIGDGTINFCLTLILIVRLLSGLRR